MANNDSPTPDRGAWSDDDLGQTVNEVLAEVPTDASERYETVRGSRALARAIQRRSKHTAASSDPKGPIVFLITDQSRVIGKRLKAIRAPEINDGSQRLFGRLQIAPSNLSSSYFLELPDSELGKIFDWIEETLGLGEVPALIYNPFSTVPELRVYENGVSDHKECRLYQLHFTKLTASELKSELDKFWKNVVVAPGKHRKCRKLWDNKTQFIPVKGPEKAVQDELGRFLSHVFPGFYVKEEEDTDFGRYDIRMSANVGIDVYTWMNYAVLELKALTGGNKTPPLTNIQTIRNQINEGVRQAATYRKPPEPSLIAALLCYDFRAHAGKRGDTCLDHARKYAKEENVELWRWPLFPTVKEYREYESPDP